MISPKRPALVFFPLFLFLVLILGVTEPASNPIVTHYVKSPVSQTLFPIQCIDTMKVSRDRAREKRTEQAKKAIIRQHIEKIASLGGNCVAIGTPYNEEFVPYMKLWVDEARKQKLRVWFRGNWSEWEGWFGYPKNMTPQQHLQKTTGFILDHPELFKDGDIFTPAPEAENGGPFNPVDSVEKTIIFRKFLVDMTTESQKAFTVINKQVTTNWLSLSGGVAKGALDTSTVGKLNNVVTIDHYVKSPKEMTEYISYFADTFNSDLVLGEFGAPIPDLNGKMTEEEQADFVEQLLFTLYKEGKTIKGINYWTLTDSSTSLLTHKGGGKEVAGVLTKYYKPAVVSGSVHGITGETVRNALIRTKDNARKVTLNDKGQFSLTIPGDTTTFVIEESKEFKGRTFTINLTPGQRIHADISVKPQGFPLLYRIKAFQRQITQQPIRLKIYKNAKEAISGGKMSNEKN